ncbi:MAG: S41 family peptidase [Gammaproteobacteria bacterium]|nr:S41 family peptidase [Gammaproteobacteria bacterium]
MRNRAWYCVVGCVFIGGASLSFGVNAADERVGQEGDASQIQMDDVQRFSNAMGLIKKYYVNKVSDKTLFDNAIRGMLSGLDPHSAYLDEEEYQELQTATNGEFGGLGLEVTMEEGVIKVVTPLVDTPAYSAGIKSNDYIVKIDNHVVQGMKLKEAVELMRGKIGSTVSLTVLRKGANKPFHYTLAREKILIKSVKSQILEGNYGYVRLTQFQALTAQEMKTAIAGLKKQAGGSLRGMILDLRNNPGGLLDTAIQVSDAFLDTPKQANHKEELIVYTEGRFPGSEFKAVANAGDVLSGVPLVVLINHGSASAAEIVAGALKDNKRALIVGTRSFGKGSVQTVLPVDDKRAIKLTTALYYTPSGVSIQAKGITPDIVIEEMQMPSVKQAATPEYFDFDEAGLSGHIANKDTKPAIAQVKALKVVPDQDLMHKDYQLYSALTILRGIAVAEHTAP